MFNISEKRRKKHAKRVEHNWELRQRKMQDAGFGPPRVQLCAQTTGDVHRARRKEREHD